MPALTCAHCGLPLTAFHPGREPGYCCVGCSIMAAALGSARSPAAANVAVVRSLILRLGLGAFFASNVMVLSLFLYSLDAPGAEAPPAARSDADPLADLPVRHAGFRVAFSTLCRGARARRAAFAVLHGQPHCAGCGRGVSILGRICRPAFRADLLRHGLHGAAAGNSGPFARSARPAPRPPRGA